MAEPSRSSEERFSPLFQLPEHIIQNVLSYLTYHEISEGRRVCQYFNRCCQELLTQGFNQIDKFHAQIQKEVKSKLPRRESERRNHELSRHVDILSAVETRLSLLSMTYSKYIDHGLCCFIPGKVLDELFTLLKKLQEKNSQPPRAHEFLQELRDISSMAMEHFEEHIIPALKQQLPAGSLSLALPDPFSPDQGSPSSMVHFSTPTMSRMPSLRQELLRLQHQMRVQSGSVQSYKKELTEQKNKMVEQRKINLEQEKKLLEQDRKLQEQSRIISEQNIRIDRLENSISDLNNRLATVYKRVSDSDVMADIAGPVGPTHRRKCKKSNQEVQKITIKTRQKRKQECDLAEEACGRGKVKSLKRKKY
ncbi:F-box only protein 28-like [Haliotis rufescens]|uniref:F-box only protein 28-like n=1 Tax=Haliotis rufescens TaxID=6454 RepID=UPI001EB04F38|nr:F-box only protein 28-like [Haliotis rufescens]